jgi:hypothetical protein
MRNFVLVTATCSEQGGTTKAGSGIRKLKRGIALEQFITTHMTELHIVGYQLLERDGTWTTIHRAETAVFTWTFTSYPEPELIDAVSHLTRDELLRDLKELLPLRAAE